MVKELFSASQPPRPDLLPLNALTTERVLDVPWGGINIKKDDGCIIFEREGEPWHEDRGFRLFITPENRLRADEKSGGAEDLYFWLKRNDLGGRLLALGQGQITVPTAEPLLVILKRIVQTSNRRANIPDVARWRIDPSGANVELILERIVHWDKSMFLRATPLVNDCPLVFREAEPEDQDKGLPIVPGANLVVLHGLRPNKNGNHYQLSLQDMGPLVGHIEFQLKRGDRGLEWVVQRPSDSLYSRLKQSPDKNWVEQVLNSLRLGSVENLKNVASGISGIEVGGQLWLFEGKEEIRAPFGEKVRFLADATRSRRQVLELTASPTNTELLLRRTGGIEVLESSEARDGNGISKSEIYLTAWEKEKLKKERPEEKPPEIEQKKQKIQNGETQNRDEARLFLV